ncbi:MAG: hypothetical protein AB1546_13010 [bacterium]
MLRNLSISLLIALFLCINVWTLSTHALPWTLTTLYLTSPLIILAMLLRARWEAHFKPDPTAIPTSLFPHFVSFILCASLAALIYFKTRHTIGFINEMGFGEEWTAGGSFIIMILSFGILSASIVIWSSTTFNRLPAGEIRLYYIAPKIFAAHSSELARLIVYLYAICYFWTLGFAVTAYFFKNYSPEILFPLAARGTIATAFSIVGSLLQLPYIIFIAIAFGGYYYILYNMIGAVPAVVFLLTALGSAGVYLLVETRLNAYLRKSA